jgi:hypothetical protein
MVSPHKFLILKECLMVTFSLALALPDIINNVLLLPSAVCVEEKEGGREREREIYASV